MAAQRASLLSRLSRQSGQAAVEWVGLVLGVALVFAALVAGGREATRAESADGLGEAVAERITCAARGACGAGHATTPTAPGGRLRDVPSGRLRDAPGGRLSDAPSGQLSDAPGGRLRGLPGGGRGVPPSAPWEGPTQLSALPGGLRPPPGAAGIVRRAWILCLGYRRWRYDVEHPLTPRQAVPVRETLKMVNECVNPLSFFFG